MKTESEFKKYLTEKGFAISGNPFGEGKWYAYKKMAGWRNCTCNNRPPSVFVEYFEIKLGPTVYYTANVGIRAATKISSRHPEVWIDFKFYALNIDECMKILPKLVKKLAKAWRAIG
jgi:hypothetical protein